MTSKEALKSLCNECEKSLANEKLRCPFRSISNDYCWEIEAIQKDLEVLDIIKKWSFIQENYKDEYGKFTQFLCNIHTIGMKEDFEKIKEWLEDE